MRFERFLKEEERCFIAQSSVHGKVHLDVPTLKKQISALLFTIECVECNRMAAVPQGAFAVLQVRKNFERAYATKFQADEEDTRDYKSSGFNAKVLQEEGRELTPLKYNSKLMNSIWGLYNRYSVHNFKKIDANDRQPGLLKAAWGALSSGPAVVSAAEVPAGARVIGATGAAH